jgi:cell division protein FtsQ
MTLMEPRVAERRKSVSEDRARKRLKWILLVILLIAVALGSLWLVRSPVLSIRQVDVTGSQQSDPAGVVQTLGMGIGTPTIDVRGDTIAAAILKDPWVEAVTVDVVWPGSVVVSVSERTPIAPVRAGDGWVLVAQDGGVIMAVADPSPDDAVVAIDQGVLVPGGVITDPAVLGALQFIASLSVARRFGLTLQAEGTGLVAETGSHRIRLGRPVDMRLKASVLDSLLDTDIPEGATISLVAPLRPAVANPQSEVEAEE